MTNFSGSPRQCRYCRPHRRAYFKPKPAPKSSSWEARTVSAAASSPSASATRPSELEPNLSTAARRNPWALIAETGLRTYERDGTQACFTNGSLHSRHQDERAFHLLEGLEDYTGPDASFTQYLSTLNATDSERISARSFPSRASTLADATATRSAPSLGAHRGRGRHRGDLAFYLLVATISGPNTFAAKDHDRA